MSVTKFAAAIGLAMLLLLSPRAALAAEGAAADAVPAVSPLPIAYAVRLIGDGTRTRLLVEFDGEPQFSVRSLASPDRILLELKPVHLAFGKSPAGKGLVGAVSEAPAARGTARLVLALTEPAQVKRSTLRPLEREGRHRLVLDLEPVTREAFRQNVRADRPAERPAPARVDARSFTVVVDPGHGGVDGGATGKGGLREKDATLTFARAFRDAMKDEPRVSVRLTRDADTFLTLNQRVDLAREHEADLLISVHADSLRQRSIRGATVYLLSRQASDAQSRRLAAAQNRADLLGAQAAPRDEQVSDILLDLMRRETALFSRSFASLLVGRLKGGVRLIGNPVRGADFFVLRAPDVPSVLLELGYLSNEEDEKLLSSEEWHGKAAGLLKEAVLGFLEPRLQAGRN